VGVTAQVLAHAWSALPKAVDLVGDSNAADRSTLRLNAEDLAKERGVFGEYVEIAGELIAEGAPDVPARIAAYWAAKRHFGVDPRVTAELAGPTDDELAAEQLAIELAESEAELRRFYRDDYPAIAAARGERPEDNPSWREYVGAAATDAPPAADPIQPPINLSRRCDWPEDSIRDDYRRHMTAAERKVFNLELEYALDNNLDRIAAARYAMQRVIDRRQRGRGAAA
jgi:hypothetical protein